MLSGTPLTTALDATFTVKVTDSAKGTATASLTLPVTLSITSTKLPPATVGIAYSQMLAAEGGAGG